jgi:hypothetical protein
MMKGRGLVLTTTNKNRLDEVLGKDSEAYEVVGKPYDLDQIKNAIGVALKGKCFPSGPARHTRHTQETGGTQSNRIQSGWHSHCCGRSRVQ